MDSVLQVFSKDAFDLEQTYTAQLRNPRNGEDVPRVLGELDAIASNLPFVAQAGRAYYADQIQNVNAWLSENGMQSLSSKSDVAAYLPFALWRLLRPGGRMAIILTASWIDTNWTDGFREALLRCYNLRAVVVSGGGRWFKKADIITHILLLEKRDAIREPSDEEEVSFCVTERHLDDLTDVKSNKAAAAAILTGRGLAEQVRVRKQQHDRLREITELGIGWNAQFVNCDWVMELPVVALTDYFEVGRGERYGCNEFAYPSCGHDIEPEYLVPMLKSTASVESYVGGPDGVAFVCTRSLEELEALGHCGALEWIRRFEDQTTSGGTPLNRLGTLNRFWYTQKTNKTADLVMPINPDKRMFVPRLTSRMFVDQRVGYFRSRQHTNTDLCFAILNSVTSYFWMEGMGFGRGLGALDLNASKFKTRMRMLDPSRLSAEARDTILRHFEPVRNRDVLELPDELDDQDRVTFDRTVLAAYRMEDLYERIKSALLSLYAIRKAAVEEG